jgi:FkbM family methyltransferase
MLRLVAELLKALECVMRLLRRRTVTHRSRLIVTYCRLKLKDAVCICRRFAPRRETFLGFDVSLDSYRSFVSQFEEIFVRQIYSLDCPNPAPVILDCGSNIGMATLFFKHKFPDARIVAFEPNPEAFAILEQNILRNHLSDVQLVKAAIGGKHGTAPLYRDPADACSLRASLLQYDGAVSVGQIGIVKLSAYIEGRIDLVKMDVEGREAEVFRELSESGKLQDVNEFVFECHHNLDSQSSLEKILAVLSENGFSYHISTYLRVDSDAFLQVNGEQNFLVRAKRCVDLVGTAGTNN